jgi:hypothetical protein
LRLASTEGAAPTLRLVFVSYLCAKMGFLLAGRARSWNPTKEKEKSARLCDETA